LFGILDELDRLLALVIKKLF